MWTYSQGSGKLIGAGGIMLAQGYSGAEPNGKNNPLAQSLTDVGPIPQGTYTVEEPVDTIEHGPYALALTPDPANEMFGRAGFLMHGDSFTHPGNASEGCIILPLFARNRVWESGDHVLEVVA